MRGYTAILFSFNSAQGRCPECEGSGVIKLEMNFLPPAFVKCETCGGSRFGRETLDIQYAGKNIAQVLDLSVEEALGFFAAHSKILRPLQALHDTGLDYLKLGQTSPTLSGGEAQRLKLVTHLLTGLKEQPELLDPKRRRNLFILEEPTIGLHPHDIQRMNGLLLRLRDAGNTVLVVEHEPETIAIADHVVDLGPGAGTAGGTVCYQGTVEGLRASGTVTGRHLDDRAALKETARAPTGRLEIRGATTNNLRDVDVAIPLGVLCVLTGVTGSGKSSLVASIPAGAGVVSIDQGVIRGSRRSNPATYSGLLDPIRKAFAKANGVKPALFSANSEGACPNCNGLGKTYTSLGFMAEVVSVCEVCEGRRYTDDVLHYRLRERNIVEVLAMPVEEAEAELTLVALLGIMDPPRADEINELIIKLKRELAVTGVVVTHDMRSARRVGRRILLLHNGRIHVDGVAEEMDGDDRLRPFRDQPLDEVEVEVPRRPLRVDGHRDGAVVVRGQRGGDD